MATTPGNWNYEGLWSKESNE